MDINCQTYLEFNESSFIPTPFVNKWINLLIPKGILGSYLLIKNGVVFYVGRSDSCLRTRLVNHELKNQATHVVWVTVSDANKAYQQECYWYNIFKDSTLNKIIPAKPAFQKKSSPFLEINEYVMSSFSNMLRLI